MNYAVGSTRPGVWAFLGATVPPQLCALPSSRGSEKLTVRALRLGLSKVEAEVTGPRQVGTQGETQGKTRSLTTHISALYPSGVHTTPSRSLCQSDNRLMSCPRDTAHISRAPN